MIFYEEIKRRRISKIKSKLYHKIKKRQRLREEEKRVETLSPHEKSEYVEKLMKNRIQERISLRHNTKNKHIQNLLRFSKFNKDSVQDAINEVNQIRHKQLEKNKID
jgi:U3 small nucleolar RNA-associated protein 14